jgi:hypothetical protein
MYVGVDPRHRHDPVVAGEDVRVTLVEVGTDRLDPVASDEDVLAPWHGAPSLVTGDDDASTEQDGSDMGVGLGIAPGGNPDTSGYGERTRHGSACRKDPATTEWPSLHGEPPTEEMPLPVVVLVGFGQFLWRANISTDDEAVSAE